jgi:hypothetical protein
MCVVIVGVELGEVGLKVPVHQGARSISMMGEWKGIMVCAKQVVREYPWIESSSPLLP